MDLVRRVVVHLNSSFLASSPQSVWPFSNCWEPDRMICPHWLPPVYCSIGHELTEIFEHLSGLVFPTENHHLFCYEEGYREFIINGGLTIRLID